MKRFCLASFNNIYLLPFARYYVEAIQRAGCECDLLVWDRDAVGGQRDRIEGFGMRCFEHLITPTSSKLQLVNGYIGATRYFRGVLDSVDYDCVVFLETLSAVACSKVLRRKYEGRYVIEVRDYSLEGLFPYRKAEERLFRSASFVTISSDAYKHFLPEGEYVVAHNISHFPEDAVLKYLDARQKKSVYEIAFVGTVRFLDINKRLLELFKNDPRFILAYYGKGSDALEEYCLQHDIRNVRFHGAFPQEETMHMYGETSIINNVYGNNTPLLDYALSNKLYHAAQLHLPILVSKDTYMEELSTRYGFGFALDWEDENPPDALFSWLESLDEEEMGRGCDEFLDKCTRENMEYCRRIDALTTGSNDA